jgi:hypothetical protein
MVAKPLAAGGDRHLVAEPDRLEARSTFVPSDSLQGTLSPTRSGALELTPPRRRRAV